MNTLSGACFFYSDEVDLLIEKAVKKILELPFFMS